MIRKAKVSGITFGVSKPLTEHEADLIAGVEECREKGLSLRQTAEILGVGLKVVRQALKWPEVLEDAQEKLEAARKARG